MADDDDGDDGAGQGVMWKLTAGGNGADVGEGSGPLSVVTTITVI